MKDDIEANVKNNEVTKYMKKHLLTAYIILFSAVLIALGVLMPKISFLYQNDSLLTQVENDQIDKVSFMDYSDNEAFNALHMIATNQFHLISDERDSDIDTRKQLKNEASSFIDLLQSYYDDYTVNYGYTGQLDFFYPMLYFYAPEPCFISVSDYEDYEYEAILDDDIIYDSLSQSADSSTGNNEWDDRPAWMISSYTRTRSSQSLFFVIDDASGKIVSFSIYEDDDVDPTPLNILDINEYIYIFTNLFTEYYNLTILSYQSEYEDSYINEEGEEVFDYFRLYFTVSDSATSDTPVVITILISYDFISFNENYQ